MHAIRLHAFGPAGNLTYEEVPEPVPAEGEVRIDVQPGGVHLIETTLRRGLAVGPHEPPALPVTPGGLDAEAAVAVITTGATAQGVLAVAQLTSHDVGLVMSAAGGLGSLFMQAARHAGAVVVGAAGGPAKVGRVRTLGAGIAIDYRDADWPAHVREALDGREVSVVLDGVGGRLGRQALELLGPGGRFLLHGWAAGEPTAITTRDLVERQLTATWAIGPNMVPAGGRRELAARALDEAAAGRLVPLITRFPLERAADAHAALEARETEGKVVLTA
ncbi:zinc-binding dehydrogenase [Streptomyces flavidovirens]|uniref:zinc-binding dehydrogenase n=1 Tax=Streptomyces flavidovirens TaxID=67298 RepID=UPI00041D1597|nr:zinc-binding dehydrogenase [Streptomyces flavidovirens]